jgi:hypothetical protein
VNDGAAARPWSSMALVRVARIAAVAIGLPYAVRLSQRVGEASGNPPVEGMQWALGVLAALFLLRAAATEITRGEEATRLKDLQWGLAAGCAIAALWRAGVIGG